MQNALQALVLFDKSLGVVGCCNTPSPPSFAEEYMKCCSACKELKSFENFAKDRSTKDGHHHRCRPCNSAYRKRAYDKNPDYYKQKQSEYRAKNPEKVKASKAEYYQRHKEKVDSFIQGWRKENRDRVIQYGKRNYHKHKDTYYAKSAKRRALEAQSVPPWAEHDKIRQVYAKSLEMGLEVDHIVPLNSSKVCGLHCWANLQLLDSSLNRSKSNRTWPDMF